MYIYLGFILLSGFWWVRKLSFFDDRYYLGFFVFDREVFGKKVYYREKKVLNLGLIFWKDIVLWIFEWVYYFKVFFYKFYYV